MSACVCGAAQHRPDHDRSAALRHAGLPRVRSHDHAQSGSPGGPRCGLCERLRPGRGVRTLAQQHRLQHVRAQPRRGAQRGLADARATQLDRESARGGIPHGQHRQDAHRAAAATGRFQAPHRSREQELRAGPARSRSRRLRSLPGAVRPEAPGDQLLSGGGELARSAGRHGVAARGGAVSRQLRGPTDDRVSGALRVRRTAVSVVRFRRPARSL